MLAITNSDMEELLFLIRRPGGLLVSVTKLFLKNLVHVITKPEDLEFTLQYSLNSDPLSK
jgi:hypothetical protein